MTPKTDTPAASTSDAAPGLFDSTVGRAPAPHPLGEGKTKELRSVALDQIDLHPINARKRLNEEGLKRLAEMMMVHGQSTPIIGREVDGRFHAYVGQRRYMAASISHTLAGTPGYEGLSPITHLDIIVLNWTPTPREIAILQAQENANEQLGYRDLVAQCLDCWNEREGMAEPDRVRAVSVDIDATPAFVRELMSLSILPQGVLDRVTKAGNVQGNAIGVRFAMRLAEVYKASPALGDAIARRISTTDDYREAATDLSAFINKMIGQGRDVQTDEAAKAVGDDDTSEGKKGDDTQNTVTDLPYVRTLRQQSPLLMTDELAAAQRALTDEDRARLRPILKPYLKASEDLEKIDEILRRLTDDAGASNRVSYLPVTPQMRDAARAADVVFIQKVGGDFADWMWVIDPVWMISTIATHLADTEEEAKARGSNAGGGVIKGSSSSLEDHDEDGREEARSSRASDISAAETRAQAKARNADIRDGLAAFWTSKDDVVLRRTAALEALIELIFSTHREPIAYYAGWTNSEYQQPKASGQGYEPMPADRILEAERLRIRKLAAKNPTLAMFALVEAVFGGALLDTDGINSASGRIMGSDKAERVFRDLIPGGDTDLRRALWAVFADGLQPHTREKHVTSFVFTDANSSADLAVASEDAPLAAIELDGSALDISPDDAAAQIADAA